MKFIIVKVFTVIYVLQIARAVDYHHHQHLPDQTEHHKKPVIPILKYETEQDQKSWRYSYETGNGIHSEEEGFIKNFGNEKHESVVQQGSVTYHDEHGNPITLTYIADEHGFRAQGEHLPTAPPIPEAILRTIEEGYQEEQQPVEENTVVDGEKTEYGQDTHEPSQSYTDAQSADLKQFSYLNGEAHNPHIGFNKRNDHD
ncbi:endocuticle structural glycoprotein SgAbd-2-like [Diorhabda carinulata]|uniref:endocuticle structural glycoprotein SgAbd-2-like n=1 Tax=Diorhabda carinulata TaxID=1163345 RepID=UPI0025A2A4C9|nr:endocuticle structural glycoprotein SgAbd-2-like [Diorhabda carinulata]